MENINMAYKHILVAVDGSKTSELAIAEAAKLAVEQKATLSIVNVINQYLDYEIVLYIAPEDLDKAVKADGEKVLRKMDKIAKEIGAQTETHLIKVRSAGDRVAEEIVAAAKKQSSDLLVIGTHGRHGFSHFFLGSVAERVIRIAPIPVLLIRGTEDETPKE